MAACSCGFDFGLDPEHATCPICGTSTQIWVGADEARAVAHVFPVTVVAESNYPDGTHEVVTGSHSHRSISRLTSDGMMSHEFEGRPARNEEDVLRACESLMETLKLQGTELQAQFRVPDGPERGIDATATTVDKDVIDVQVVGVRQQDLLAELGRTGEASSAATADELADDVCRRGRGEAEQMPCE